MNMANKSTLRLAAEWFDRNFGNIVVTGILIGVVVISFNLIYTAISGPVKPTARDAAYAQCAKRGGTWNEGSQGYWCSYPAGE